MQKKKNSEPMVIKATVLPLYPNNLTEWEWVKVNYEGKKFLGKVVYVAAKGQVNVRCLEKPFGVRKAH